MANPNEKNKEENSELIITRSDVQKVIKFLQNIDLATQEFAGFTRLFDEPNQLTNRGDGTGFKIRIIGNGTNSSSGKIDEKTIIANSSGTTPIIVLNSALSFTPQSGDRYGFLSGRLFMMSDSNFPIIFSIGDYPLISEGVYLNA